MSNDMYLPALPAIGKDLGVADAFVQATISAWLFGASLPLLFLGPFSDRFGRRPLLFGGGILFLLSTIFCMLSPNILQLILARFFQGLAVSSFTVAAYASVHELYPEKQAIGVLAWLGGAAALAPMLGPTVGSALLFFGEWRLIFGFLFFWGAIFLIPTWILLPESNVERDHHALRLKRLFSVYGSLLMTKRFLLGSIAYAFIYGAGVIWLANSPFLIIRGLHLLPEKYGFVQLPVFAGFLIGTQLVHPLLRLWKPATLVFVGFIISFLSGIVFVGWAFLVEKQLLGLLIPMSFVTFGAGLTSAPLVKATLSSSEQKKGASVALFYTLSALIAGAATLWAGFLEETALMLGEEILVLLVLAGLALVIKYRTAAKE